MALLLGVGFLAGVLTAISPCVLPVLPILLAGGAAGGRELAARFRAPWLRPALGVAIALAGVAIVFHADTRAQTALGGYTNRLQGWIEGNGAVTRRLRGEDGSAALAATRAPGAGLED